MNAGKNVFDTRNMYLQINFFIYRTGKNWISTILGKSLVFQTPSEILIVSEFYTKHKNELASLLHTKHVLVSILKISGAWMIFSMIR